MPVRGLQKIILTLRFWAGQRNDFDILKFLFLADIFGIKLPKEENIFKSMITKLTNMKTDFVCAFGRHTVRGSGWAC